MLQFESLSSENLESPEPPRFQVVKVGFVEVP